MLAASVLDDARAELIAIISECMLRHMLAWGPPPCRSKGVNVEGLDRNVGSVIGFGFSLRFRWSMGKEPAGRVPVFRAPPSYPER